MKDFAVLFKREDNSIGVQGYYEYLKRALSEAKKCNECKYLHYEYYVKDLVNNIIIK